MTHRWVSQIGWLLLYDLRQQTRERGTLLLLAVALVLAAVALLQGEQFRHNTAQAMAQAQAQQSAALATAKAEAAAYFADPGAPEYTGLRWWRSSFDLRGYAFREHLGFASKPPLPGAALAIGQGDVLPAVVRVKAESMDSVRQGADIAHPQRLAAGRFDLMFFVVSLWPLVLLALTLSALTQDREKRRLPALALLGVTPPQLLLAQTVARVLAATVVLLLFVGALALLVGALPASGTGLAAWLAWSAVLLAYSLFWAGVAALVCARATTRSTAAFAGFGAWVGIVVLLPALVAAVVALAAPMPSREAYIVAVRDATDGVQANRVGVMQRFYDQHPEWRPARTTLDKLPAPVTRLARAIELERALADVDAGFERAREQQASLLRRLSLISPVSLSFETLSVLAGQDAARHQRFLAEVQQHQRALRNFFQARIQQAAINEERQPCPPIHGTPGTGTCQGRYGFDDFEAVPRFVASSALVAAPGAAAPVAVLLVWAVLLLVLGGWLARTRRSPDPHAIPLQTRAA